tara:strand:- start:843 stop:2024 length:1182 start_codon:yes stop_codon:yes gene_type:complete
MFGTYGKPSNEFANDNAPKREFTKPKSIFDRGMNPYYRFRIKTDTEAEVAFLDDRYSYTEDQLRHMECIGVMQGPITVHEHRLKLNRNGRVTYNNYYTCANKGVRMTSLLRLYYYKKAGSWPTISKFIRDSEIDGGVDDIFKALVTNPNIDANMLVEVLSEAQYSRIRDIIETPLGGIMDCPICDEDYKKNRPRLATFRTVIDLREWEDRNGNTHINELKLFDSTGAASNSLMDQEENGGPGNMMKPKKGLGGFVLRIKRSPNYVTVGNDRVDRSPAVGTSHIPCNIYDLAQLNEINDNATFNMNKDNVLSRLNDEDQFYRFVSILKLNEDPKIISSEEIVEQIMGSFDEGSNIPWSSDYLDLLLPKTPSFINEFVYNKDPDSNEKELEEVPF